MKKALLILMLALAACARTTPSGDGDLNVGIIGGSGVQAADPIAASTAFILLYNARTHDAATCSAVLLSNDILATAAHCFWPASGPRRDGSYVKFVVFGTSVDIQSADTFKRAITIPETSYALHPGYSNLSNKDSLALIRLPTPLPKGLIPAKILPPTVSIANPVTVAGFGITSEDQAVQPPNLYTLKSLAMTLGKVVDADCPLCVNLNEAPNARPAHGDSGGPGFTTVNGVTYVWGVDSHSKDDSYTNEFYTPLAPYISWIQQTAKALGSTNAIVISAPANRVPAKVTSVKAQPKKSLSKSSAYSRASKPQRVKTRA